MGAGIRSRATDTVKLTGRNRQGLANDLQLTNASHFPTLLAFLRSCANATQRPYYGTALSLVVCILVHPQRLRK